MEYKMTIHDAKDKLPLKSGTYLVKTSKYFNSWQVLSYSAKFKKFNTFDSQENDRDAISGYMWAELPGEDSEVERVACPDCNGSGVYQEYDEYDRYYVYTCYKCEGTGTIARQSVKGEKVAISKTETAGCENRKTKIEKKYDDFRSYNAQGDCYKYVCSCNNCDQVLWEVADYDYGQGEKGHTPNYCPACGRKLKGE